MSDADAAQPWQVHDLLRIATADALRFDAPPPDWVAASLLRAPWLVVRRLAPRGGHIAVGVRGPRREQRYAGWLDPDAVLECRAPQQLRTAADMRGNAALHALQRVEQAWADADDVPPWGPAGSVGFELASGVPTTSAASDLDLVLRCPQPIAAALASALLARLPASLPAKLDIMLELPEGGIALTEYASGAQQLLLRGPEGARWWSERR